MLFARRKNPTTSTSTSNRSGTRSHPSISQDSDEHIVVRDHGSVPLQISSVNFCGALQKRQTGPSRILYILGLLLTLLLGVSAYLLSQNKIELFRRPAAGDETDTTETTKSVSAGASGDKLPSEETASDTETKTGTPFREQRDKKNHQEEDHTDSCVWSPTEQNDCKRLLAHRVGKIQATSKKRWLFFGDSTVAQLWQTSSLENILVDLAAMKWNERARIKKEDSDCLIMTTNSSYYCEAHRIHQQCELNEPFGIARPDVWEPPILELGEGPLLMTSTTSTLKAKTLPDPEQRLDRNATCLGCKNCQSSFLSCSVVHDLQKTINSSQDQHSTFSEPEPLSCKQATQSQQSQLPLHGGYFAMPFARDVVLQSPDARTTQENIVAYIEKEQREKRAAVCVVRVGLHDMALPNMTFSKFVANVRWYLELLLFSNTGNNNLGVCFHVIWLQNTAPRWKDDGDIPSGSPPHHIQTIQRVRDYDVAVRDMISSSLLSGGGKLQDYVTAVDTFEASKTWTHSDNIHLTSDWNRALGIFFVKVATKMAAPAH